MRITEDSGLRQRRFPTEGSNETPSAIARIGKETLKGVGRVTGAVAGGVSGLVTAVVLTAEIEGRILAETNAFSPAHDETLKELIAIGSPLIAAAFIGTIAGAVIVDSNRERLWALGGYLGSKSASCASWLFRKVHTR